MRLALGMCALSLAFLASDARPSFVARIPNGNGVSGVAALGHVNPSGGGATNAFGRAFGTAGHQWTTGLCQADSDGDGATNGEELGDPCCSWAPSTGFGGQSSVARLSPTHPGVPNSFTATQLAAMTCGGEADRDSTAPSGAASTALSVPGDIPASDSQASASSGFGSSSSSSNSGSFGDVVAPDDQPRFSPGPKKDETPQTPVTSDAGRQGGFAIGFCSGTMALLLLA
ncbi:mRNA splicing factor [Phytophthora cinnamomi]|uniref:mRNA splicing factor n=1 Tax=Phytophthora cinnamomi TaxID=4785 RepID=UPI00355A7D61|nr:mRNA splicing factor [Phytophthora cinnamomi]